MARGKTSKKVKAGLSSKGANQKVSDTFLTQNKNKMGIFTTDSGLQYEIIEEGEGLIPFKDSSVTVHQRIKLIDETVVADTYKVDTPERFDMKDAIAGYYEGLLLMKEGARYRFFIPADLAWGKRGAGTKIGPYMVIIIDCRLISVD